MSYWIERNRKTQLALMDKSIKETNKQMRIYYDNAMKRTIGRFEKTYNKVLLSSVGGREPTPADLYKLDTYWQMVSQLEKELTMLGDRQARLLRKEFEACFIHVYEAIAIPGEDAYSKIDTQVAHQLLQYIWCADGKSWSDRVWTNTKMLQQELNDTLLDCVISGRKSGDLKQLLMERFNVSYNRADALVRTELAHIQTQAAQQRYKDYGIKQMEVFVDEDEKTCPTCAKMEGTKVNVNALMPVPFHPRCRCCMIPVIE